MDKWLGPYCSLAAYLLEPSALIRKLYQAQVNET